MTTRTIALLFLSACAGSPAPETSIPTPPAERPPPSPTGSSTAFFACEKAVREAASASTSGVDKAKVVELATAAEKPCDGVHAPNTTWARKIRDAAK
ncbi:MAG TPA: hypothetical protein PKB00_05050 [Microthrixaceae bacterium]|nr:hypothetical protein [Microthrixaceae bacterium]HNH37913.1 hypothetical protein [Microthrixaceae bacterium]